MAAKRKPGNGRKVIDRTKFNFGWAEMKPGDIKVYPGTITGVKANVCRANKRYAPAQFGWDRDGKSLIVVRIE